MLNHEKLYNPYEFIANIHQNQNEYNIIILEELHEIVFLGNESKYYRYDYHDIDFILELKVEDIIYDINRTFAFRTTKLPILQTFNRF